MSDPARAAAVARHAGGQAAQASGWREGRELRHTYTSLAVHGSLQALLASLGGGGAMGCCETAVAPVEKKPLRKRPQQLVET